MAAGLTHAWSYHDGVLGGSVCVVVFAVVTGVVVAAGFDGVDAVGVVVDEPVVLGGVLVVDGGVAVVDGVVVEALVDGGVVPGVVVPLVEPVAGVVPGGVVEVPVVGVVAGGVVGVVDGVVLDAVEPVPVVGGVVVAAGVLLSAVGGALLPQMSSFETLASGLPVAGGVVALVEGVVAGGVVAAGAGGVVAAVFAPFLAVSCRSFSFF